MRSVAKVAESFGLKELELGEHLAVVADLVFVGRKVAVPEKRHALLERSRRGEHPVGPPVSDAIGLEPTGAQPIEELVDDGLHGSVAAGFDVDSECLPIRLRGVGGCWAARRKGVEPGIKNAGSVKRRQRRVRDAIEENTWATAPAGPSAVAASISAGVAPNPVRSSRCRAWRSVHASAATGSSGPAAAEVAAQNKIAHAQT